LKRILKYCLLTVSLLIGVTTINLYNSEIVFNASTHVETEKKYDLSNANDCFSQQKLPFEQSGNQELRIFVGSQSIPERILDETNSLRINHFRQLSMQKIYSSGIDFTKQLTQKESFGFYLFFLCKILI